MLAAGPQHPGQMRTSCGGNQGAAAGLSDGLGHLDRAAFDAAGSQRREDLQDTRLRHIGLRSKQGHAVFAPWTAAKGEP